MIASANAADIGTGGMKDLAPPPYSWAGWYVGVNGGGIWGNDASLFSTEQDWWKYDDSWYSKEFSNKRDITPSGGFGGGQVGFNWQRDRLVYGLETDFQGVGMDNSANINPADYWNENNTRAHASTQLDWFGTFRGRLGLTVWDHTLVYFTGGVAYGGVQDTFSQGLWDNYHQAWRNLSFNKNETDVGYVLGGGVEYAWSPAWSLKAEYMYMDLGARDFHNFADQICNIDLSSSIKGSSAYEFARIGINYHWAPAYEPLK